MSLRIRLIFNFPHFQILAISIVLSLLGISEIVFAIVAFVQRIWGFYVGSGLWGGCAAFLAGVAGIVAANTKGVCIVRTFLITSLLSLLVTVPLLVLSAGGLHPDSNFYLHHGLRNAKRNYSSTKLIHGFLLAFSVIQMGLSAITFFVCLKHLYLNGRTIRNRHAKQLTKLRVGTGDHILSRPSTSSSHAPLVTSSAHRPKKKYRRHSSSNRHSAHSSDPLVDHSSEQRHHHGHRHHGRGGPRPRQTPSQPDSMEHMNSSLSADRQDTVESLEMHQQSCDNRPETNVTRAEPAFQSSRERGTISHPIPIDEDEELPPYEESLREIDGESVFPMSLSENCSNRESSSISSSDDMSSGDDNVDVEVWESVSQTHLRTTMNQRSDVGISPTVSYLTNPQSASSQSSAAHARPLVGSQTFATQAPGGKNKLQNNPSNSSLEESAMTDPQGVLYHGFSRNMDKIDNISKERKAQRSQSFQCERALARENLRSSGRSNASVPNKDYHYDKDLRLSGIRGVGGDAVEMAPLKPPRISLVESTDNENKTIQSMNLDHRTSWNAVDRQRANLSDVARPKVFSPPVLHNMSSNSKIKTVSNSKIYPKEPQFASPHVHLHTTSMKVKETYDGKRHKSVNKPQNVAVRTQPNSANNGSKYTDTGGKSVGISLNPYFRPITQSAFVDPLTEQLEGNRLSKSGQNRTVPVSFPANISIDNSEPNTKSCNSHLNIDHKKTPYSTNSISKPHDSKIFPDTMDSHCIDNANRIRFSGSSLQESLSQKHTVTSAVKQPSSFELSKDKIGSAGQRAVSMEPVKQALPSYSEHRQQQKSGQLYPQYQKPEQHTDKLLSRHSEYHTQPHTPQYEHQNPRTQNADNHQTLSHVEQQPLPQNVPLSRTEQQSTPSQRQPVPQNPPHSNPKQEPSPQNVPSHPEQPPQDQQLPLQPPPNLPLGEQPPLHLPHVEQPPSHAEPHAEQPPLHLPHAEQPPPHLQHTEQPPSYAEPHAEQPPPHAEPHSEPPPPHLPQAEQPPPHAEPHAEPPPPHLPQAEQPPPHAEPQAEPPPPHAEQPPPHAEQPQQIQNQRSQPMYSLLL